MSQPMPTDPAPRLLQLAQTLRETHHLGAEAQKELADLIEELSGALPSAPSATSSQAHLADSTAHLVDALHHQRDIGVLTLAKARLAEAAARTEAEAPLATGIIHRLIEALANLGI